MMDTVLFTDYGIVGFAITTSAIALILSFGHRSVIISVKR